jgi:hypothetical protein
LDEERIAELTGRKIRFDTSTFSDHIPLFEQKLG